MTEKKTELSSAPGVSGSTNAQPQWIHNKKTSVGCIWDERKKTTEIHSDLRQSEGDCDDEDRILH